MSTPPYASAAAIASAVRRGETTARAVAEAALARIDAVNPAINAYTRVIRDRALSEADAVDAAIARGEGAPPLAGVPFAVKNLFDISGMPTVAGSKINREWAPAAQDAALIRRMNAAGAVLTGALNMGEYAYDFTGENAHDGACRNPHDPSRMTGGSSSGSGAATAAGIAPVSLGSDTNGSLRVPASLCGVFSLKPTYGRLSRAGTFPFVDSLDHVGPLARSTEDLALAYDVLQGPDRADHAAADIPVQPIGPLPEELGALRVGVLCGWFAEHQAREAVERVTEALAGPASVAPVMLDEAKVGRAAAYLITNAESAAFHLDRLRSRADDFDPDTRDRFLAGALLPSVWVTRAQRVRRWWLDRVMAAFADIDCLVAPATPFAAPMIGQKTIEIGGQEVPLRPNLGLFAQPFSCVGLPVVTMPVFRPGALPIGVQVIAPPWREDTCLRVTAWLERQGIATAHAPEAIEMPAT